MQSHSKLDNFIILKTLGSGYSGKVKLGQDVNTGNTYALKILSNQGEPTQELIKALKHEFDILKELHHPSIIKMFDLKEGVYLSKKTGLTKNLFYAVLELATGGEIFDLIFHSKGFDENLSRFYFKKLVESLRYLHNSNIAHRDLKPENILLDSNFNLKVVDFGFAVLVNPNVLNKTRLGTEKYMAPELLYKKKYDARKADVFAAGVILFVFYSGHPPFNQATEHDPYYRVFVKNNEKFWDFHSKQNQKRKYSESFKELVNSMLSLDPEKRCNIEDIVNSFQWFSEPTNDEEALFKVSTYAKDMYQIKQQADLNNQHVGGVRDENASDHLLEELQNLVLPDLKYSDLTDVPNPQIGNTGFKLKTKNKELLVALILKNAQHFGGVKDEARNDKLIIDFNNSVTGNVSVEIKIYQLSANEVDITIVRRSGDYFLFQKTKNQIHNGIMNSCETKEVQNP